MNMLKKALKETSVLNTDSFDKRRFKEIYQMSRGLQQMENKEEIPFFNELLGDIWASLYKMSPKLKKEDEIPDQLQVNKQLIKQILDDSSYKNYHEISKLDDLVAAIGTIKFGEYVNEWVKKQKEENKKLQQQIENINKLMEKLNEQQNNNENQSGTEKSGKKNSNCHSEQTLNEMMSELGNQVGELIKNNSQSFSKAINQAIQETKDAKKGLESLFGGIKAGSGQGELQKMPLRNKLELAEVLSKNEKMKEIANWTGKFIPIARSKQKTKHKNSVERSGVEMGDDLERLLPAELVQYTNPKTKREFLRRLTEKETLQYEQKGKESLGKGSIILCLDQSGSMKKLETQSKGFALAIMAIARKQKRNFVYIPFSGNVGEVREFKKGKISPKEMVEIAQEFLDQGTNFQKPLETTLDFIIKDKFKNGDIIFITDGQAAVSNKFLNKFNDVKKAKKFHVLSLLIGEDADEETVEEFSDKVLKIENLNHEGSFKAFEI